MALLPLQWRESYVPKLLNPINQTNLIFFPILQCYLQYWFLAKLKLGRQTA